MLEHQPVSMMVSQIDSLLTKQCVFCGDFMIDILEAVNQRPNPKTIPIKPRSKPLHMGENTGAQVVENRNQILIGRASLEDWDLI